MKRLPFLFLCLFLTACAAASTHETENSASRNRSSNRNYLQPRALTEFVNRLTAEGRDWRQHGIYIESLEDGEPVAMLNEEIAFNPASVVKLATTFAALDKLGPEHRFRTEFFADGEINPHTGTLDGNLILQSGGDPAFSIADARLASDELRRLGIRRVTGSLVVNGEFTCNENSRTQVSAGVFRRQSQVTFLNQTQFEPRSSVMTGRFLFAIESDSLLSIVRYLNAHSINAMADLLATHIGGPDGVQQFLHTRVGLPLNAICISYASGLEVNRMTPRDTVTLLRKYLRWLSDRQLSPEAVMSVAGLDAGTLYGRFSGSSFAGSVIAKTGTLHSTDDGVAALAGLLWTRQCGALLFTVYDMAQGRRVLHLRRVQDDFLKQLALECGGPAPVVRRDVEHFDPRPQSRVVR